MKLKSTLKTATSLSFTIVAALLISCSEPSNQNREREFYETATAAQDPILAKLLSGVSQTQVFSMKSTVFAANEKKVSVDCDFKNKSIIIGEVDSLESYNTQAVEVLRECLPTSSTADAYTKAHRSIYSAMTGSVNSEIKFARDIVVTTDMTMTPDHRELEVNYKSKNTQYTSKLEMTHDDGPF
jgi:hypothetical protein